MTIECDNVLTGIVSALALAYLAFQLRNKRWSAVNAFVVISALLCCGSQFSIVPCSNICVCLLLAIIGSNVVALPTTVSHQPAHETFANEDDPKTDGDTGDTDDADDASDDDDGKAEDGDGKKSSKKKTKHATKKKKATKKDDDEDDHDDDDDDVKDDHVDSFSTFMETYRSLAPDQVESMTTDTKDLISTQKALMETVQNLAPVITQGKEMMDTFKDYFGPNGTSDMMKAFQTKKTV